MTQRILPWAIFLTVFNLSSSAEPMIVSSCEPPVTVYTHFEQGHSALLLETVKEEVRSIMAPVGLQLQWRSVETHTQAALSSELAVVSFKGKCRMDDLLLQPVDSGGLGWTYARDGHVSPFSDVDCDRIRQFINSAVIRTKWEDRDAVLGRALGRVLAHELYHIFSDSKQHARNGVTKAVFTPRDLLSDNLTLEQKDANALRHGKLHRVIEQAMRTPPVSCP